MYGGLLVFMRRFAVRKQWGWAAACVGAAVAGFVVASWPDMDSVGVQLVLASAIQFAFVAALAARLVTELADDVTGSIDAEIELTVDDRSWS